ncbi:transcription-repair coupling factor [Alicyclobacillus cycloheptanicus]|uniref:Transcription-repair-coupling factor n=1 Tax=Alicyclobacillus cycloheptanicus TaxID=1457 RepID=A0ABT9XIX8_9BACL|nr:transcription-repair coupling factor [Alicyclobacillus cycloheptanicus]MDQ0190157.1 transcription-repair coupling factor (superfamily II helicase) [Alicyclobacillus cycloheptanicus]WDM02588.1 transcription-repair coupling factor [Alicyclobacillus cycloheptanicus]
MIELAELLAADKEFQTLLSGVTAGGPDGLVTGLGGGARHLYYAATWVAERRRHLDTSLLIVTHSVTEAETIAEDLKEFLPAEQVFIYPERELSIVDVIAYSREVIADRLRVLQHLAEGKPAVVVATVASVLQPVMKRDLYRSHLLHLEVGQELPSNYVEWLIQSGYERVEMVETQGQFSVRGGILDVFPLTTDLPYRLELFDTEIDSIRKFDVGTQRSLEQLREAVIGPALDFLVPPSQMAEAADELSHHLEQRIRTLTDMEVRDRLQTTVGADIRKLRDGLPFYGQLRYTAQFARHVHTLMDYFPTPASIILDEPSRIQEREKGLEKEFQEWVASALMRGELLSGTVTDLQFDPLWKHENMRGFHYSTFARAAGTHRYSGILNITAKSMQNFHGQMNLLKSEMQRWHRSGTRVFLLAATEERANRLERVLEDYRIEAVRTGQVTETLTPQILVGSLSTGFELPMSRIAVIVETEVFGSRKKGRRLRAEMSDAERIKSYQELRPGDYVVHVNHGIGKYLGIRTLDIDGRHKDYLHLQYAGNDSLYVPVEQIDQVQRYIGSEEKEPKVYHLGGTEWARVKQRVSRSVKDIAEDLVKLYAARQATPGHAYPPDTPWQKDFETMFPYDETPDQLRAIDEIKRDMEQPRPMDRLLCGDVGYGKTEVAIRAAFKAVMDGKQVAVLVPTTVLAHQHYETFKERFAGFPATVEVLSRFRSRGESQAVLKGLKDGSIDVVIGTHRLLQKSVQFKDLGLLIVDEEQRFGVTHKERLKQMRTNVDCLTLTATPIPRTLHMSMLGVRDLSVIETPPENRFPVQTYVVEFNESLVREAIERELGRGGQVYFVFNQVGAIRGMADRIQRLVPEARIGIAHGQMAEDELERVMLDFLEGDIDVLVTTTIIETGLDIPNVNTLIVYDADRLGLSQLYQLRGRVGRSNRIAYAYFTYQKDKVLTEVAEKRLQAIKEFTELGSGFKIAMRDLAIRGAGNLLGAEQHGFINSVGFDLYNEMLTNAVKEAKGVVEETPPEPSIDLQIEAYLPDEFIPNPAQKIAVYKKFKFVRSQEAADDLQEELVDRYGDLPDSVANLLDVTRIKSYAMRYGVEAITQQGYETTIRFPASASVQFNHGALFALTKQYKGQYLKRGNGTLQVSFRTKDLSDRKLCKLLLTFFADFHKVVQSEEVTQLAKS